MRPPISLLTALLLLAPCARAEFMQAPLAPVDRLLPRAETYLAEHPTEANAHYTLARIHYLAFSAKRDQVPAYPDRENGKVQIPERALIPQVSTTNPVAKDPKELGEAAVLAHAIAARKNFQEALKLDPANGLYQLGLAYLQDEMRTWLAAARPAGVPPEWQKLTPAQIREGYAKAFDLGMAKDKSAVFIPPAGLESITSYEAARAFTRLAEEKDAALTDAERRKLDEIKAALVKFGQLRRGPITPIVFAMQPARHLDDLLADDVTVDFDLRGYGLAERWPWVKPELGFLVWDPQATGHIASARQLFGSYSFEIFRQNGYEALAALDDDGDGQLAGDELKGLRVWFDRNSDGVSTTDEVVPLESLGITAISTTACAKDGLYPMNPAGLKLRDGRTLPTWDWIVSPR